MTEITLVLIVAGALVAFLLVVLVVARTRPKRDATTPGPLAAPPAPPVAAAPPITPPIEVEPEPVEETLVPEAEPSPVEPERVEQVEAPAKLVEAPAPPVEPVSKETLRRRLAQGLTRSRGAIAERLALLVRRDKLDDEAFDEIEEALIRADVGVKATTRIVDVLRDEGVAPADLEQRLREQLTQILRKGDPQLKRISGGLSVWLVTGVNGVGKTTSIAKLAHNLRSQGATVVLAAADTFRAAAIDQLGTWAERAGVHMVKHEPGSDPGAVVFDAIEHAKARGIDVLIVDTAGRLHTKSNLMEELKKIRRIAEREAGEIAETLLVLDATVGQNGIAQARTFQEAIDVTGVVLTKLDGTARGGIVVAVQEELGIPVKAIGVGETIEDLQPFDPEEFAAALLEG